MWLPRMRFLFVGPGFCLRLPSDSGSPRTPLPSGYRFPPSGSEEDFHLQVTGQIPYLTGRCVCTTRHAWRTPVKLPAFSCRLLWSKVHVLQGRCGGVPRRGGSGRTPGRFQALTVGARGRPPPALACADIFYSRDVEAKDLPPDHLSVTQAAPPLPQHDRRKLKRKL